MRAAYLRSAQRWRLARGAGVVGGIYGSIFRLEFSQRSCNTEYAKLWPNITLKKEPPADAKDWEGVPDKGRYFSPNPGDGT
jgi:Domain of unknown function (DUF3470)